MPHLGVINVEAGNQNLKRHLDRKIVFSEESSHNSLYTWFLQEITEDGKPCGREQIPWQWTQRFRVTSIELVRKLETEKWPTKDDGVAGPPKDKNYIMCQLLPGTNSYLAHDETEFSMLGTDRVIEDFTLQISIVDDGKEEEVRVWGSVSYTSEIDFRDNMSPDSLTFIMSVSAARYAEYIRQIEHQIIDTAEFTIDTVDGFYAEWSPAISTSRIKVLTGYDKDQRINVPKESAVKPPRLGKVGEYEFRTVRRSDLKSNRPIIEVENEPDHPPQQLRVSKLGPTDKLLSSIRIAAWLIVAFLILILLK